ncbi:putative Metallopeptidase [Balamuthia mandrillaris]
MKRQTSSTLWSLSLPLCVLALLCLPALSSASWFRLQSEREERGGDLPFEDRCETEKWMAKEEARMGLMERSMMPSSMSPSMMNSTSRALLEELKARIEARSNNHLAHKRQRQDDDDDDGGGNAEQLPASLPEIYVPLSYHIMKREDGSGDIPNQWVFDQTDALNEAFKDLNIHFSTSSIDRWSNDVWAKCDFDDPTFEDMTERISVNPGRHVQIYACREKGVLGGAFLPQSFGGNEIDPRFGLYVHSHSLPGGCKGRYNEGDTVIHEMGHYFGLQHTFYKDGECDREGDGISDTPTEKGPHYGPCPGGPGPNWDSCPQKGYDPVDNFMNYSDDVCLNRFTTEQKAFMLLTLMQAKRRLLLNRAPVPQAAKSFPDIDPNFADPCSDANDSGGDSILRPHSLLTTLLYLLFA